VVPNLHRLAVGLRGQSELAIGIRKSAVGRIVGDVDDRLFNGRAFLVDHHTRELLLLCRQLELEWIAKPPARHPWAWLLQRVFTVDIMTCRVAAVRCAW
jgi:hypothetical protein